MIHDYVVSLLVFAAASVVFAMTPGLDTVMVLRTSTSEGHKAGMGAVLGVGLGLAVWGIAAAFGLAALIAASQTAFAILKYAGALYLGWLGFQSLLFPRKSLEKTEGKEVEQETGGRDVFLAGLRRGFLSNLLNPKAGVIVLTLYPQFIPHHVDVALFTLCMTAIQVIVASLWLVLLVFLTIPLGRFLKRPKIVQWSDRIAGLIFIGFGLKLITSHNRTA
ncbi:LysE family translocator [Acetobacteraceae bacterium ESL0709]|nr:LysE family translocator [Acetobacteraceae bacterium ESL0697]MDF7677669.1 LysE family translocator [Acetobacteraceae bacterium ESL0709]